MTRPMRDYINKPRWKSKHQINKVEKYFDDIDYGDVFLVISVICGLMIIISKSWVIFELAWYLFLSIFQK
jgi:hypothetical protein